MKAKIPNLKKNQANHQVEARVRDEQKAQEHRLKMLRRYLQRTGLNCQTVSGLYLMRTLNHPG